MSVLKEINAAIGLLYPAQYPHSIGSIKCSLPIAIFLNYLKFPEIGGGLDQYYFHYITAAPLYEILQINAATESLICLQSDPKNDQEINRLLVDQIKEIALRDFIDIARDWTISRERGTYFYKSTNKDYSYVSYFLDYLINKKGYKRWISIDKNTIDSKDYLVLGGDEAKILEFIDSIREEALSTLPPTLDLLV
jgi:hypothetical protein